MLPSVPWCSSVAQVVMQVCDRRPPANHAPTVKMRQPDLMAVVEALNDNDFSVVRDAWLHTCVRRARTQICMECACTQQQCVM